MEDKRAELRNKERELQDIEEKHQVSRRQQASAEGCQDEVPGEGQRGSFDVGGRITHKPMFAYTPAKTTRLLALRRNMDEGDIGDAEAWNAPKHNKPTRPFEHSGS